VVNHADPSGWGVFLTADGVTTCVHLGIGTLSEARQELERMEPYWAEAHAEEIRSDEGGTFSALALALGLPIGSVWFGTSWGWIIAQETP
jgi:hypothetical protein